MKFVIQPIQRGANVIDLAFSAVMGPLTQPRAAKIKTQYRKTETVQRLHGVKNHFVMKSSAIDGMGMTNQRRIARFRSACIQQGFQAAYRPIENDRSNRTGLHIHWVHPA